MEFFGIYAGFAKGAVGLGIFVAAIFVARYLLVYRYRDGKRRYDFRKTREVMKLFEDFSGVHLDFKQSGFRRDKGRFGVYETRYIGCMDPVAAVDAALKYLERRGYKARINMHRPNQILTTAAVCPRGNEGCLTFVLTA